MRLYESVVVWRTLCDTPAVVLYQVGRRAPVQNESIRLARLPVSLCLINSRM
jgi:hypothetical protein